MMARTNPLPSPDREQTDASLHDERSKSDSAMANGQAAVNNVADEVLRRARGEADAVLLTAREHADASLRQTDPPATASAAVALERVNEDASLERERDAADEVLRFERAETARVLNRLLPVERDQTDKFLFRERIRSDAAVANRDDFLGLVSHDLRDLLSAIVMSTEIIVRDTGHSQPGERTRSETGRIQRNAARMNRLISDLVDIASIDAGRLCVVPVRDDLGALITEAVDAFRDSAAVKAIRIDGMVPEGATAVFDHSRVFQVVANLLLNSIKFTPRGGSISVACEQAEGAWRCSVSDTGPGIPAAHVESIFDRFSQGDQPDRRGLGLGLFISKCIVEAHGGKIWADSSPGRGARVTFTLPSLELSR
jgi:signal transduction histidine kinase